MKEFSCDTVLPGCAAIFQAHNDEDILVQVASHAFEDHKMTDVPVTLVAEVRQHIRAV